MYKNNYIETEKERNHFFQSTLEFCVPSEKGEKRKEDEREESSSIIMTLSIHCCSEKQGKEISSSPPDLRHSLSLSRWNSFSPFFFSNLHPFSHSIRNLFSQLNRPRIFNIKCTQTKIDLVWWSFSFLSTSSSHSLSSLFFFLSPLSVLLSLPSLF